jgi:MerR family transcriptional regulator, repressor of the yfmOP operon
VNEYRIGEVANRAGVTTRTLRYYEELGLLQPSGRSPGGARRYSAEDVDVLVRIRELQDVMGLDLQTIRRIVQTEGHLRDLREEYQDRADARRRREILTEAIELNDELRVAVRARLDRIGQFLDDLDQKAARYRARLSEGEPEDNRGASVQRRRR